MSFCGLCCWWPFLLAGLAYPNRRDTSGRGIRGGFSVVKYRVPMGAMGLTKTLGAGYFVSFAGREVLFCLLAVYPSVSCPSAGCVASLGDPPSPFGLWRASTVLGQAGCPAGAARHVPGGCCVFSDPSACGASPGGCFSSYVFCSSCPPMG